MRPNEGERSEGAGGTSGRLTPCNIATPQELLHCTHSKARDFKKGQKDDANCVKKRNALSEPVRREGGAQQVGAQGKDQVSLWGQAPARDDLHRTRGGVWGGCGKLCTVVGHVVWERGGSRPVVRIHTGRRGCWGCNSGPHREDPLIPGRAEAWQLGRGCSFAHVLSTLCCSACSPPPRSILPFACWGRDDTSIHP